MKATFSVESSLWTSLRRLVVLRITMFSDSMALEWSTPFEYAWKHELSKRKQRQPKSDFPTRSGLEKGGRFSWSINILLDIHCKPSRPINCSMNQEKAIVAIDTIADWNWLEVRH